MTQEPVETVDALNKCLEVVTGWLKVNKQKLYSDMSEVLLVDNMAKDQ